MNTLVKQVLEDTSMKEHPESPFLWKNNKTPTVFALDPHFRSRQKAGLI
jgi:hypothetical protein